jgi:hypothetical protein
MDDKEYLEAVVSQLDIPLSKVEYRRVCSASNDSVKQVGLFGSADNMLAKDVKTKGKRKAKTRDVPTYTSW